MKEILRVETADEANLIRTRLESCGIEVFLKDEEIISTYPLYSNAIGGVKILVNREDADAAKSILDFPPLGLEEKRCPSCNLKRVRQRTLDVSTVVAVFFPFFVLPSYLKSYVCLDCRGTFSAEELLVEDIARTPGYQALVQEVEKTKNCEEARVLPGYFSLVKGALAGAVIFVALTPLYYHWHEELPGFSHFLIVCLAGGIVGGILRYSDEIRKRSIGN